ncbi:hypothetical protein K474DRAFT_1754495 [Panus rudis PR-1116 ss-1]|nr:hypothetical protein K474DRAFT_1754495 [Panus rudis PR-1116 ss-1]
MQSDTSSGAMPDLLMCIRTCTGFNKKDYHGYNQSAVESILPNLISRLEGVESRLESAETKIENLVETIKLDQQRLYARLLNSNVIKNKLPITPLPMANGKAPPNFPATKGEFEHLTKERYEALLKAYNQPIKGDINAKQEALREFIGLTAADK